MGIDRLGKRLEDYAERGSHLPVLRERVRLLAESQWGEPAIVVQLAEVRPEFDVPGRRADGTVKGRRLVRRFFWNILRGVCTAVLNVVVLVTAGGVAGRSTRHGRVTGPENAAALGLVDAARSARSPWLVHTGRPDDGPWFTFAPSRVAVVDGHEWNRFADLEDTPPPAFVWQSAAPHAPTISPKRRRLTWPDGSVFEYHVAAGNQAS